MNTNKHWLEAYNNSLSEEEKEKLNESIKVNKKLIEKFSDLGLEKINERVIFDKNFLLEVQSKGYNPLDAEDVNNYLEHLPPKDEYRNFVACGGDKYKYLGQGEYEEDDIKKFVKKTGANVTPKSTKDIYLNDYDKENREILLEKTKDIDWNFENVKLEKEDSIPYKDINEAEDKLRKNIAKVFGSENIQIKEEKVFETNQLEKRNTNVEKTLELIKELKALGFSNEEIKQEIKLRF